MLIHSTQTELILAACCLAAWPASVNIRQLDHCDRGITVLHGTTLLAITNLLHIFLQERLWASAAAVAFCRLVTSIMFNSRAQKLKRHLGDEAVILQGLHRDISRSSKRRTKLLKPSEDSIIYIYTYIVLNTHTYTRMCIYIYLSLSLSARVWMSSTQPFPEPTPLATHFHKTSLESNVLQMLGSSSLRSAQENMGKPSKKIVDFPLLFGWLSESIRGYVNWIPLGWLSHLWTTAPCYTTTQLNNVAPACGSAIHFPVRQEALRINRRQGAEFHLLGRSLGVKCCLI